MGNPIRTAQTQQSASCSTGPRGYHLSGHGLASVPKGSRASFRTCQHSGKGRLGSAWTGQAARLEDATGKEMNLARCAPTTAANLRGTRAGTRRLWVQGYWARRRRLGVFSLQHLARRSGEGGSPDSTHQLLQAGRGRAAAAGAPRSTARSSRPMARSINKSGPHTGPPRGREPRSGFGATEPVRGRGGVWIERGDPTHSPLGPHALTSHCLRARRMPL